MGIIKINDLSIQATIGVSAEERAFPSLLTLQVVIELDIISAAKADDLELTVDYEAVIERLKQVCAQGEYLLLERLIADCGKLLLEEFPVIEKVSIDAHKMIFPETSSVSVQDTFTRAIL